MHLEHQTLMYATLTDMVFPSHRGGPMWQADKIGIDKINKEIESHRNADNLSWPESNLLNKLESSNEKLGAFVPDTSNPKRTS